MSRAKNWTVENIGRLDGTTVVVTGANSGIGFEATKVLAERGAHVVMACRNVQKGQTARQQIHGSCEVALLDLSSLTSIVNFSSEYRDRHDKLDILINNAGVMATPYRQTNDQFELQFGTNHLGHFALTGQLLQPLIAAGLSRVVTVSSAAHTAGTIRWNDLAWKTGYSEMRAYAMSKLANLLFAYELQRKFSAGQAETISVACHPGYAATNLQTIRPERFLTHVLNVLMKFSNAVIAQSASMGALPILFGALSSEVTGGDFVGPDKGLRGYPTKVTSNDKSLDESAAARLWSISEQLTGVTFDGI